MIPLNQTSSKPCCVNRPLASAEITSSVYPVEGRSLHQSPTHFTSPNIDSMKSVIKEIPTMTTTTPAELTTLALWGTPADQGMENQNLTEIIARIAQALPNATTPERAALRHRLGYLALMVGDARPKALEAFNLMREGA